jgi:hypothetical protein
MLITRNYKYKTLTNLHILQIAESSQFEDACSLVFAELISSTLKMEAICSSETSVETQRTTRRQIPEDDTLHNHRCENFRSYIMPCSPVKVNRGFGETYHLYLQGQRVSQARNHI